MPKAKHGPRQFVGIAGEDMSAFAAYTLLFKSTTVEGEVLRTTSNTVRPSSVLLNQPEAGDACEGIVLRGGDVVPMICSAAIAIGVAVSPAASGKIVTDDGGAGDFVVGTADEVGSADLDLIGVFVQPFES